MCITLSAPNIVIRYNQKEDVKGWTQAHCYPHSTHKEKVAHATGMALEPSYWLHSG